MARPRSAASQSTVDAAALITAPHYDRPPLSGALLVFGVALSPGARRVSFRVPHGDAVTLCGLGSAEEVALLRIIAGVGNGNGLADEDAAGRVTIGGASQTALSPTEWRRRVTAVSTMLRPEPPVECGIEAVAPKRRSRLVARFGITAAAYDRVLAGGRCTQWSSPAERCVHAALSPAPVVLVDDLSVLHNAGLRTALLAELAARHATVVCAGLSAPVDGLRPLDLSPSPRD